MFRVRFGHKSKNSYMVMSALLYTTAAQQFQGTLNMKICWDGEMLFNLHEFFSAWFWGGHTTNTSTWTADLKRPSGIGRPFPRHAPPLPTSITTATATATAAL